jgi:hypothetical protein
MVLQNWYESSTFILVFHRILDFKTGLNFYSDPFFFGAVATAKKSHRPAMTIIRYREKAC